MAGRVQQDTFIDDSDDTCPLCVEELDLSDRNFRPCPCGYQVCQFCFNNIKNNMNGLCPACRRHYDEKTIEWKVVSPEEFKADVQKQARKKAEIRQKEAQKREVESLNRKHLSGLRVVQKNLVYVVGLNPRIREEDLLQTLRGEQYFGQYGKIVKIVVSKAKDGGHGNQPLGVYVTFVRVQDAERCIAAVDGSENGGRTLRAQFGTTKYCSAYLRNETCMNKSCMFLHEPGEEKDSFTRQDLSSINVVSTQRPAQADPSLSAAGDSRQADVHGQPPQPQPPAQRAPTAIVAASQPMGRLPSKEGTISPVDSGDGSALPSSVSWAAKGGQQQQSRRTSQSASASTPSPMLASASLNMQSRDNGKKAAATSDQSPDQPSVVQPGQSSTSSTEQSIASTKPQQRVTQSITPSLLDDLMRSVSSPQFKFVFSATMFSPEEYHSIINYPPLLDPDGGARRRAARDREQQDLQSQNSQAQRSLQGSPKSQMDDVPGSGSFQLGGEPEDGHEANESIGRADISSVGNQEPQHRTIQPPSQQHSMVSSAPGFGFAQAQNMVSDVASGLSAHGRSFTPSQQHQFSLLKPADSHSGSFLDQLPQHLAPPAQQQQSGLFQNQAQQFGPTGHARQSSRYTFANDSASASAAVKPAANAKLMAQQSAMMPAGTGSHQSSQNQTGQPYAGGYHGNTTQGPPPGLKSSGTPPISGGGMFSQGHGFAASSGLGRSGSALDEKSELLRDMFRTRGGANGAGSSQAPEAAKRGQYLPAFDEAADPEDSLVSQEASKASLHITTHPVSGDRHPQDLDVLPSGLPPPSTSTAAKPRVESTHLTRQAEQETKGRAPSANLPVIPAVPIVAPTSSSKPSKDAVAATELSSAEMYGTAKASEQRDVPDHDKTTEETHDIQTARKPGKEERSKADSSTTDIQQLVSEKSATKRSHPGKLDIAAAADSFRQSLPGAAGTHNSVTLPTDDSRSNTPSAVSSRDQEFPALRPSQPKNIRVVATPKLETPPVLPSLPSASHGASNSPTVHHPSRKASLASINRPATPSSEMISDNASMTSASLSRANSPPPKVGLAPVRQTTKSQQKKQRKDNKKELEKKAQDEAVANTPVEEKEIAPIVGRKKKQQKSKAANAVAEDATTVSSRPDSPKGKVKAKEGEVRDRAGIKPPLKVVIPGPAKKEDAAEHEEAAQAEELKEAEPEVEQEQASSASAAASDLNAVSIIADLIASGEVDLAEHDFFKPVGSLKARPEINATTFIDLHRKLALTHQDQINLSEGRPVRLPRPGTATTEPTSLSSRVLITPGGYFLRGLSAEKEERILELERHVSNHPGPTKYIPARHMGENGFFMVGGRVVQGGASAMPAPPAAAQPGSCSPAGPAHKMRVDEALNYINQFVLPALPAANASAEDVPASPDTGLAPDPNRYAPYVTPSAAAGFGADVAGVVQYMAAGLDGAGRSEVVGGPRAQLPSVPLMNADDAESAMLAARKETEAIEKRLNALLRKNKRLVLGASGP